MAQAPKCTKDSNEELISQILESLADKEITKIQSYVDDKKELEKYAETYMNELAKSGGKRKTRKPSKGGADNQIVPLDENLASYERKLADFQRFLQGYKFKVRGEVVDMNKLQRDGWKTWLEHFKEVYADAKCRKYFRQVYDNKNGNYAQLVYEMFKRAAYLSILGRTLRGFKNLFQCIQNEFDEEMDETPMLQFHAAIGDPMLYQDMYEAMRNTSIHTFVIGTYTYVDGKQADVAAWKERLSEYFSRDSIEANEYTTLSLSYNIRWYIQGRRVTYLKKWFDMICLVLMFAIYSRQDTNTNCECGDFNEGVFTWDKQECYTNRVQWNYADINHHEQKQFNVICRLHSGSIRVFGSSRPFLSHNASVPPSSTAVELTRDQKELCTKIHEMIKSHIRNRIEHYRIRNDDMDINKKRFVFLLGLIADDKRNEPTNLETFRAHMGVGNDQQMITLYAILTILYRIVLANKAAYIGSNVTEDEMYNKLLKDIKRAVQEYYLSEPQAGGGRLKGKARKGSYESMTVKELKARCAKRGIKHTGLTKAQIIAVLRRRKT